jgi:hypothetical protein
MMNFEVSTENSNSKNPNCFKLKVESITTDVTASGRRQPSRRPCDDYRKFVGKQYQSGLDIILFQIAVRLLSLLTDNA